MLTRAELDDASEQLGRLLELIESGELEDSHITHAYLSGARATLAAVLRPTDELEEPRR